LVFAAKGSFLEAPLSALGLVPENGSAVNFSQSIGVHRANEFLMFGQRLTAEELENWGLVNKIFPTKGFHNSVKGYLQKQLQINDGKSMMEMKRLQNAPLRDIRMLAVHDSMDALAERFVEGAPLERFALKKAELEGESPST
jgi:peroxisomal 3,2-trans-enoyl-CoA isomerase